MASKIYQRKLTEIKGEIHSEFNKPLSRKSRQKSSFKLFMLPSGLSTEPRTQTQLLAAFF
jgi:hypothetical protein